MKKITLLIVLVCVFLSAHVFAADSEVQQLIDKGVNKAIEGISSASYEVLDYQEGFDETLNKALISFKLKIKELNYYVVVTGKTKQKAQQNIPQAIMNSLKYLPPDTSSSLNLDYSFKTSLSSLPKEKIKNGTLFKAKGENGKTYGLLIANTEKESEVVQFEVIWKNNLRPNLQLEKIGANLLSIFFSLNPINLSTNLNLNVGLEYRNLSFLFPINPTLSFDWEHILNKEAFLFGLGASYDLRISALTTNEFVLFKNGGVTTSVFFKIGLYDKYFVFGSELNCFYTYNFSSRFNMEIGYSYLALLSQQTKYTSFYQSSKVVIKGGIRF